jgi:hypothetical protein
VVSSNGNPKDNLLATKNCKEKKRKELWVLTIKLQIMKVKGAIIKHLSNLRNPLDKMCHSW